ncbi:MAG TPA: hypothetical protein PLD93_06260 [Synergistaceae bacterium]|nr:hypothetical protein [Synergistaceae bacterium]
MARFHAMTLLSLSMTRVASGRNSMMSVSLLWDSRSASSARFCSVTSC